jgi:hypothetical protein
MAIPFYYFTIISGVFISYGTINNLSKQYSNTHSTLIRYHFAIFLIRAQQRPALFIDFRTYQYLIILLLILFRSLRPLGKLYHRAPRADYARCIIKAISLCLTIIRHWWHALMYLRHSFIAQRYTLSITPFFHINTLQFTITSAVLISRLPFHLLRACWLITYADTTAMPFVTRARHTRCAFIFHIQIHISV